MIIYFMSFVLFFSSSFCMLETQSSLQKKIELLRQKQEDDKHKQKQLAWQTSFNNACANAYDCNIAELKKFVTESNVNALDKTGKPIIFAAIQRSFDDPDAPVNKVFDFLIEKGASVDTIEPNQISSAFEHAIHLSASQPKKNLLALQYFLRIGVSPFSAPPSKKTAFEIALNYVVENKKEKNKRLSPLYPQAQTVLELFRSRVRNLHQAIITFNVEKVKELANEKSVQKKTDGARPIYTAITHFTQFNSKQMLEIIKILLKQNIDLHEEIKCIKLIKIKTNDPKKPRIEQEYYLNTYLMIATIRSIVQGNTDMIPVLLDAGADPHKAFGDEPSAFILANRAAGLTIADVESQCSQGFSKEVNRIAKNRRVAAAIVALFEKNNPKN